MPCLILLGTLLAQGADARCEELFKRIAFAPSAPRNEGEGRVFAFFRDRKPWIAAFKAVEQNLGPFPDSVKRIKVTFDLQGERALEIDAGGPEAFVRFNPARLSYLQAKADEIEKKKRLLGANKKIVFHIPPLRFDRLIRHAVARLFQGDYDAPSWFLQGMAAWVGGDMNYLSGYAFYRDEVRRIGEPYDEPGDAWGRGHSFFNWLERRGVLGKVVRATILRRGPWKPSIQEALGMTWDDIVEAEQKWSEAEIDKLRPPVRKKKRRP